MKIKNFIIAVVLASFVPTLGIAQVATPIGQNAKSEINTLKSVNCFDYYSFGSVQVDIAPERIATNSGMPLKFTGNIKNANKYPIVDGAVYVKIFKKQIGAENSQQNGHLLVDQFFAVRDVNLPAEKQMSVSFDWNVPAFALSGDYYIATYFVSQDKFNLLGLSFTDDVTGNTSNFKVFGEEKVGVSFDKNEVTVNGGKYMFAAFPPKINKDKPIKISFNLKNDTATLQKVPVTYRLYFWDGLRFENILNTESELVAVSPFGSKNLSYTINDTGHPVYYLTVETTYKDTKSILDIRAVRDGVNQARINFVATKNYPFKSGGKNEVFACIHNTNAGDIEKGKLVLSVSDSSGKKVFDNVYEGKITSQIMGFSGSFTPAKGFSDFSIKAELYEGDKLVDSANMIYACKNIDPSVCGKSLSFGLGGWPLAIVIILAVLLVGFWLKNSRTKEGMVAMLVVSVVKILMVLVVLVSFSTIADAQTSPTTPYTVNTNSVPISPVGKTVSWSANPPLQPGFRLEAYKDWHFLRCNGGTGGSNYRPGFQIPFLFLKEAYAYDCGSTGESLGFVSVDNMNVTVAYGVQMYNVSSGSQTPIAVGGDVSIGTKIIFVKTPHLNEHISWNLTGGTFDTPFGYWANFTRGTLSSYGVSGASSIGIPKCEAKDKIVNQAFQNTKVGSEISYKYFDFFTPVVVKPPDTLIRNLSGLINTGLKDTDGNEIYAVTKTGPLSADFVFLSAPDNAITEFQFQEVGTTNCSTFDDFTFTVPEQVITFTLNGVGVPPPTNQPPIKPTITKPNCIEVGSQAIFTTSSTDPEGNNLKYNYNFNGESTTTSSFVTSETSFDILKTFSVTGQRTLTVNAEDMYNATSSASTISFTVLSAGSCTPIVPQISYSTLSCRNYGAGKAEIEINPTVTPNATHYKIELKITTDGSYSSSTIAVASSLAKRADGMLIFITGPLDPLSSYNFRVAASFNGGSTWSAFSPEIKIKPSNCDPEDSDLICRGVNYTGATQKICVADYNGFVNLTPEGISNTWSMFWDKCTPTAYPMHEGWVRAGWLNSRLSSSQVGDNSGYQDFSAFNSSTGLYFYNATGLVKKEYTFGWVCNKTKAGANNTSPARPVNVCVKPPSVQITGLALNSSTIVVTWNKPSVHYSFGLHYILTVDGTLSIPIDNAGYDLAGNSYCTSVSTYDAPFGKCSYTHTGLSAGSLHTYQLQVLAEYELCDPIKSITVMTDKDIVTPKCSINLYVNNKGGATFNWSTGNANPVLKWDTTNFASGKMCSVSGNINSQWTNSGLKDCSSDGTTKSQTIDMSTLSDNQSYTTKLQFIENGTVSCESQPVTINKNSTPISNDFSLWANPTNIELVAVGSPVGKSIVSSKSTITVNRSKDPVTGLKNFNETVNLTVGDVKVNGVTIDKAKFASVLTSAGTDKMTLQVWSKNSSDPISDGTYTITVNGVASPSGKAHSTEVILKVRTVTPEYNEY